jgi:tetratricopeptide (TPR) repeat protein
VPAAIALGALALILGAGRAAHAQIPGMRVVELPPAVDARDPRSPATVWDYARQPGLRRAEAAALSAARLQLEAQRSYLRDLALQPEVADANRALILQTARALYRDALSLVPDMGSALLGLADVLELQGDYTAAVALLTRARALLVRRPELGPALFRLGVVLTRMERYAEVRDVYEEYVSLPMDTEERGSGLCNLAETYVSLHDLSRAVATYHACVDLRPDYEGAWWGLASALDRDGRTMEAERAAHEALNRDPEWNGIHGRNVFYVPPYDVRYYEALAYHASEQPGPELAAWELYLNEGGARGPFAARARWHVAELTERLQRAREQGRAPRREAPRGGRR